MRNPNTIICTVIAMLFVSGLGYYATVAIQPPRALPKDAPADQFSAYRAIDHAFACSMEPHPSGSKNNDRVAEYFLEALKDIGLEAEFMAKPAVYDNNAVWQQAVIGRIPGTANTGAVAFNAHYDSVAYGPGATDDISGCIAMLETARAFMHLPRMKNDLLFVFTDGEEVIPFLSRAHNTGAVGFTTHPAAQEIGVMTVTDNRGDGPTILLETSSGNGALVSELMAARQEGVLPIGNSLTYAVYQATPLGSDFGTFKQAGMKGYSIAYFNGMKSYHTPNDSPENISPESVQHVGAYLMGIAKHFGNTDFGKLDLQTPDTTYFNTLGFHMVQYPMSLTKPLALLAGGLLLLAIALGFWRKRITPVGYVKSMLVFPLAALTSLCVATLLFCLVYGFKNVYHTYFVQFTYVPEPRALYQGNLYCYSIGLMTIAVMGAAYWLAGRKLRAEELQAAGMTWLIPVLAVLQFYVPEGSFLVMWPVLFGALGLGVLCAGRRQDAPGPYALLVATLLAAPALCLWTPAWQQLMWLTSIIGSGLLAFAITLLILNLMPPLALLARVRGGGLVWPVLAVVSLLMLTAGLLMSGPSKDQPLTNSVAYAADLDAHQAFWLSEDVKVDEWTKQFFPDETRGAVSDILPWVRGNHYLRAKAPLAENLTGIRHEVLTDELTGGKRRITMRLTSNDAPWDMALRQTSGPEITGATVNDLPVSWGDKEFSINFLLLPPEGWVVTLETTPGEPVAFEVFSISHGLPQVPNITPRPEYMIPESNIMRHGISLRAEHIFVKNSFAL